MSEIHPLVKDCNIIISQHKNLDKLFVQLDRVIEYWLSKENIELDDLIEGLEILGGEAFSKVVMFVMINSNKLNFNELEDLEISQELLEHFRYFSSKYGNSLSDLLAKKEKEFGWKYVNFTINKYPEENQLLAFHIEVNNGNKFHIEDEPSSMVRLCGHIVNALEQLDNSKLSSKEVEDTVIALNDLKSKVNLIKNELMS